jgi:hypothetical protein
MSSPAAIPSDRVLIIGTVYYLVHSMGGKTLFKNEEYAEKDRTAAKRSMAAADAAGPARI